jgi:hypothetical protein
MRVLGQTDVHGIRGDGIAVEVIHRDDLYDTESLIDYHCML